MKEGLCRDLISEILYRLPPKSILRLRCGSRWMCSEIDDPEFSKNYLRNALDRGSSQPLIVRSNLQFYLGEDFLNFPTEEQFLSLGPSTPVLDLNLCCSCDGLVVISGRRGEAVIIWNPNTRKHRILPTPEVVYASHDKDLIIKFGLGYDFLSDDYKLVRIVQYFSCAFTVEVNSEVSVYSFKSNAWKNVENLPHREWHLKTEGYNPVVAHGAIHFGGTKGRLPIVVAFDMHSEQFRELPRLPDSGHPCCSLTDLRVMGGKLCGVFMYFFHGMEVWTMEDYGGEKESWNRWFRFRMSPYPSFDYLGSWKKVMLPNYRREFEWLEFERTGRRGKGLYNEYATLVVASIVSVGGVDGENETFPDSTLLHDNLWEPESEDTSDSEMDYDEDDSSSEDEDEYEEEDSEVEDGGDQ